MSALIYRYRRVFIMEANNPHGEFYSVQNRFPTVHADFAITSRDIRAFFIHPRRSIHFPSRGRCGGECFSFIRVRFPYAVDGREDRLSGREVGNIKAAIGMHAVALVEIVGQVAVVVQHLAHARRALRRFHADGVDKIHLQTTATP